MKSILDYIAEHYRENLSLGSLADELHLSPPYLSSLFSAHLNTTFLDYYNDVRLSQAMKPLLETDAPIESVSTACGYSNAQAFVRAFKAKYHCLPSQYRKDHHPADLTGMGRDRRTSYLTAEEDRNNLSDFSLLVRYLPDSGQGSSAQSPVPYERRIARWDKVKSELNPAYRRLIGLGSAKEVLYREVQEQLREMQDKIGFEYINFHGIFSDEMMVVTRSSSGDLAFNFRVVDMVFDFLFSIRLKPFIDLCFMPIELAADRRKMIFNNRYNTSQPSHTSEWVQLVEAFFQHLISRYGLEFVVTLPVTLWNNPDSSVEMFGMQDDLAFYEMYRDTFLAVKRIDERIRFGSPPITFMHEESTEWARRFFNWLSGEQIRPDFFCAQHYCVVWQPSSPKIDLHSWQPDHLVAARNSPYPLMAGIPISTDPDFMEHSLSFLHDFQSELGLSDLPLWITEWNNSVSHRNLINDTMFGGCYVVKNVLEHSQGLNVLGYWCATDYIEEQTLPPETFHGGLGLMTVNGIRKPQFLAFQTLNQLRPMVLENGPGYLISRSDNTLTILLYNYEHYNDLFAGNKTFNVNLTTRYTPFVIKERRHFRIRVDAFPNRDILESAEFIVNREYGSAFDYWLKMGAPEGGVLPSLDRYRLNHLKASAHPLVRSFKPEVKNHSFYYDAVLEPLEFRLVQITLR